jgi:acyl-coenzyme A thioesterase PaaI-like protein
MISLSKAQRVLWLFGLAKIPMIGYVSPKLILMDDKKIVIKVPYKRKTRNHLKSIYLGALVVGADLVAGFHAFAIGKELNKNLSIVFKDFHAEFIKRPMSEVYFVCNEGLEVRKMIHDSSESGERITRNIPIEAFTNYPDDTELIANFSLGLSIKVK